MTHGATAAPFRVRSLTTSVYLPNFLFAVGQGAAIPIVPLLALDLGTSIAAAGVVVALRGVGTIVFDLPAGLLVARFGERRAMLAATATLAIVAYVAGTRPSPLLYAGLIFMVGCAWSVWVLARLSYAAGASPIGYRGRVMSMIGGAGRVGHFLGPLVSSVAVTRYGLSAAFFVQAAMALAACSILAITSGRDRAAMDGEIEAAVDRHVAQGTLRDVLRHHRRSLATAGVATITVQVLRSARQAVLPLWGVHLGLDAGQVAAIFGLSAAADMTLFYPVGRLMDWKGRKWAALPCIVLLSIGMALTPLTGDFASLAGVGALMGVGNGLGTGINMTLGSDLSPTIGRSQFLGVWRLITDVGTAGGPLLVAVTTSVGSLRAAAVVVAAVGAAGATVLWKAVPETLAGANAAG
ncbi:MAG: MFS transporter [Acidimicrobiales bacterium]